MRKNGIEVNKNYFAKGYRDNQIKTKENVKNLLLSNKEITMLLISSHTLATYTVDACRELDLKIGQDISLVSFDSNILSSIAPFMTVVGQPVEEINKQFIKLIDNKIQNLDKNFNYLYKSKLIDNDSVAKLK